MAWSGPCDQAEGLQVLEVLRKQKGRGEETHNSSNSQYIKLTLYYGLFSK
jgi:hypothetical protein